MAVYIITGKLGAGKTLVAVGRIQEYLNAGRSVATNLDINLTPMMGKTKKNTRLLRLPDHPSLYDVETIGLGYVGDFDDSKTGAIVLDECGTWLNSRDWQDSGRRELLDYLLHIRKRRWDVFFIIQDISVLDKQFRKSLAEHVVYCRRLDRMNIPLISTIAKMAGFKMKMPKAHFAIVRYGDLPTSLIVDKWLYRGTQFYDFYDTEQVFKADHLAAVYSVLPTYYIYRNSICDRNFSFYFRFFKILFRKYRVPALFVVGTLFAWGLS